MTINKITASPPAMTDNAAHAVQGVRTADHSVLSKFVRTMADDTADRVGFRWQGTLAAPSTFQELRSAFDHSAATGEPLLISSVRSGLSIFLSAEDCLALRFWHDISHVECGRSFRLEDEVTLAWSHLAAAEQSGIEEGSSAHALLAYDLIDQSVLVTGCFERGLLANMLAEIRHLHDHV